MLWIPGPFAMSSLFALALITGCVKQLPLRTSSAERVPAEEAKFDLSADQAIVEHDMEAIAGREGLKLARKVPVPGGGNVWVFRGDRAELLDVRAGGGVAVAEMHGIGTWLAARVVPTSTGTRVSLLAKPSVDGTEVCSSADGELKDVQYWCQDTKVREDFDKRSLVDGRVEAELVTRISRQLRGSAGATPPAPPSTGGTKL